MVIQVNCLHVQTQPLFCLPSNTISCVYSHCTEKQRRLSFPLETKEGCWHNLLAFLWIVLKKTVFAIRTGTQSHQHAESFRLSPPLQIILCNAILLLHFGTTHYSESPIKVQSLFQEKCSYAPTKLGTYFQWRHGPPSIDLLGAHELCAKNP